MVEELLANELRQAFSFLDREHVTEIRLRLNKPIVVNISGAQRYFCPTGDTLKFSDAFVCKKSHIDYALQVASDSSLFAVNSQIVNGYISYRSGVRIGVCGEIVNSKDQIKTIKNINSLNIRVPHSVKNCSLPIYKLLFDGDRLYSTLIVSSPGCGKTTLLRDIAYQLSNRRPDMNVLICDERNEICGVDNGHDTLEVSDYADVYTNCSKKYAFENGIRSMKPDVIITDELNMSSDIDAVKYALTSGVKVLASVHAKDINELKQKKEFSDVLKTEMFDRYIVLSNRSGVGTIECVYDKTLRTVYS